MPRFHVEVMSKWGRLVAVDAKNATEAREMVKNGGGVAVTEEEYIEDLPARTWDVSLFNDD